MEPSRRPRHDEHPRASAILALQGYEQEYEQTYEQTYEPRFVLLPRIGGVGIRMVVAPRARRGGIGPLRKA